MVYLRPNLDLLFRFKAESYEDILLVPIYVGFISQKFFWYYNTDNIFKDVKVTDVLFYSHLSVFEYNHKVLLLNFYGKMVP